MSDWCIEHKMTRDECADKHTIRELEKQLAAADAIIMGARNAIVAEYDEKMTLADRIDALLREMTVINVQLNYARALLLLPILFYKPGPVTDEMREHWDLATGSTEMTTKVMCDAIREFLDSGE
jgi:hypothetical protein